MKANRLIHASSPYLLQHAYNPVDWHEWSEEALALAKEKDRPILVSIGYSACHWCHVMERESFENEQIAQLMNEHLICIKIDREERPDLDQIYMEAVQLMGIGGGWPLNVLLLPDGRPFYGGTYFPPENWTNMLQAVAKAYREGREELEASATELSQGIAQSEVKKYGLESKDVSISIDKLPSMFEQLAKKFDIERGGMRRTPKFPMPSIYEFLMRYARFGKQPVAWRQTELTLDAMAFGGIYDQIGGGFARYSVDADWFAPHFEKMLYDNAQLISIYSDAFQVSSAPRYQEVVEETIAFIARELTDASGGFYAALDADSEGEEGKFYVWQVGQLKKLLPEEDMAIFEAYYHIKASGNWEHGNNILHRSMPDEEFAAHHNLSLGLLQQKVAHWKQLLLSERNNRVRPGLDDKVLTAWNGLMLQALAKAFTTFQHEVYLAMALKNAHFIKNELTHEGTLWRTYKNGKATIKGFAEDYATVIAGYISLYQASFEAAWLYEAQKLVDYMMENFYDAEEGFFFFTDQHSEQLIARKKEIFDNVIPSSNSMMARNLYALGILLDRPDYSTIAQNMVGKIVNLLDKELHYLSNWASLYIDLPQPISEVAIIGEEALAFAREMQQHYFPNTFFVAQSEETENTLPLLQHRTAIDGKTTIYVCQNHACQLPVYSVEEAMQLLRRP